ncbi:hypothetical protein Tco_1237795 [Tanacetum coccineum]
MSLSTPKLASMITSPTPNFLFQSPMHKYEDEEPLALTFGIGHCRDTDRWHSRREFLKSYNLSSGRSSVKEKMKRSVRKIGLRVYRLTWTWPSVFVLRCYVPLPSIEVKVVSQDHMHGEHDVFLEHLSHGYLHLAVFARSDGGVGDGVSEWRWLKVVEVVVLGNGGGGSSGGDIS